MVFTTKPKDQVRNEGPRPLHMPKPMDETPPQMRGPALHISEVRSLLKYCSQGPRADMLINQFSILNLYTWGVGGSGFPGTLQMLIHLILPTTVQSVSMFVIPYIISQSSALC